MMLAVEFADFGFGTVVGAAVAAFVAIFLDQRRRKDEKKNRFLDEKRLMYRNVVQAFEAMAQQIDLFSKFEPFFRKAEELDPEAQELLQQASENLHRMFTETRRRYRDDGTDFSLLASAAAKRSLSGALGTMQQMLICIGADEPCDVSIMQVILEEELQIFRYYARQDLGIDT
jgi:gas vesicle protein